MTRRVVVTGACGGLGRAIAARFRNEGWHVVGVDRREPDDDVPLDAFLLADIGADGAVAEVFEKVRRFDRLDALVNNAAVQINKPITDTSDDEWSSVINTNVRSAFQAIRESTEMLSNSRGAVVNISSVHAIATSVSLIIAQRLARRLCNNCKEIKDIPREALEKEGFTAEELDDGVTIFGPKDNGCKQCNDGYKGRLGIFQVMEVSEAMGRIIMEGGNAMQIAEQAAKEGVIDLRQAGLNKVKEGITSLEEVNRVTIE